MEYHLQQAAKAFQKHRWMLQCQDCSIKHRLRYFQAIVSSTACFAAEHRPLCRKHLQKYDVQFRKLVRRIMGPPPGTDWSAQWHSILHEWNMRVDRWARASGISSWSQKCMIQYWKFASYIANLLAERWVRRHLRGIHFQQIVPVGAHNKLGTQNWKCSAGTKLSATGKVLREMRFNGMPGFRLSYISAPCKRCYHVF